MEADLVSELQKIAVLRVNALGDRILCLPTLDALRAAYPGAELRYLSLPRHADFLPGRAVDDRVVVMPAA